VVDLVFQVTTLSPVLPIEAVAVAGFVNPVTVVLLLVTVPLVLLSLVIQPLKNYEYLRKSR
jgi:ABC-type transport system involved in cytochrome bd biosynthesis fused ATPase/permease subunit